MLLAPQGVRIKLAPWCGLVCVPTAQAILASDKAQLVQLHAAARTALAGITAGSVPTPTPLPLPGRLHPVWMDGEPTVSGVQMWHATAGCFAGTV